MPLTKPVRSGLNTIKGLYEKVPTEGDINRYYTAVEGLKTVIGTNAGTSYVTSTTSGGITYYTFTLPFAYTPNLRQLMVGVISNTTGMIQWLCDRDTLSTCPSSSYFSYSGTLIWYEEASSTQVNIFNLQTLPSYIIFYVPATAAPASNEECVVVNDQANNMAIELLGRGNGIAFNTPSGYRRLLRVDDNGDVSTEPI